MNPLGILCLAATAAIVVYVFFDWPNLAAAAGGERASEPAPLPWRPSCLIVVDPLGLELELPLTAGWDADAILSTVEQIEAL